MKSVPFFQIHTILRLRFTAALRIQLAFARGVPRVLLQDFATPLPRRFKMPALPLVLMSRGALPNNLLERTATPPAQRER